MATANDKHFSDAKWQAQGPKLLEPTKVRSSVIPKTLWLAQGPKLLEPTKVRASVIPKTP